MAGHPAGATRYQAWWFANRPGLPGARAQVDAVFLRRRYVLVVIEHARRVTLDVIKGSPGGLRDEPPVE